MVKILNGKLILLAVILLAGVAGYFLVSQSWDRPARISRQGAVQLTPDVSLQYYTTLTPAQPQVRLGTQKGWPKLYDFLPPNWGKSLPYVQPIEGNAINSFIELSANGGTMILMAYLSQGYRAEQSPEELRDKVSDVLDELKIKSVRFLADGYGVSSPVELTLDNIMHRARSGGMRHTAGDENLLFLRLPLNGVPVTARELTIQLLQKPYTSDNNPVIREFTVANPFYQAVTPSTDVASTLPITIKDGSLEVTLRALVSGAAKTDSILTSEKRGFMADLLKAASGVTTGSEKRRITFIPNKPIPDAAAIPLDYFAPATTDTKAFTYLVADVTSAGETQSEWGVDSVDVTYGKEKFSFGRGGESTFSYDKTHVRIYNGILSVYPQPISVSIELVRKSNFPSDESQTVEIALPKAGTQIGTKQTLKFHNGAISNVILGYQSQEHDDGRIKLMLDPKALSVIYKGYIQGGLEEIELLAPNGKTLPIENQSVGSSSQGTSGMTTNLQNFYIPQSKNGSLVNYDDYTTARLTFRSPRKYPHKFEFTVTAEEAKGPAPATE